MDIKKIAYKYAIKNAFLHKGKADVGAVIGKVIALKKEETGFDLKKAMPVIQEAVKEVNAMGFSEIEKEFREFEKEGYELKIREKKEGLPELEWAKKEKVITRFAPNPNGPFHLGNARAAVLSYLFAEKYKGKFILRFDDTDPKVKKPIENAEAIFREDLEWLGCKIDKIVFASDRLELYYEYMKKLIEKGHAYVCTCDVEKWRALIKKKKGCKCRENKPERVAELFEKMLSHRFKEGEAVLRLKTDLQHKDPSVRDWWMAKVVDKPEHPRVGDKYIVWPSYNFASAIDDHELGITLIIRGQEHEQNKTKQEFIYNYFGWKYPHCFHTGRLSLEGAIISKSKIKEGIEKGIYFGWDDPRLGTIKALRRRGFKAEALVKVLVNVGVKSNDATIQWNTIAAENRALLEKEAEPITFIQEPVYLTADLTPQKEVDGHMLKAGVQRFIVEKKEIEKYGVGKVVRLRNAYNVRIKEMSELEVFAEYVGDVKLKEIVPWVLQGVDISIMMPNGCEIHGIADEKILEKKKGEYCWFDRFGFVIVDYIEGETIKCWFTHK